MDRLDDLGSVRTQDMLPEENIELHRTMGAPPPPPPPPATQIDDGLFWPVTSIAVATFGTLLYREHNHLMSDQRVQARQDRDHMQQVLQKAKAAPRKRL